MGQNAEQIEVVVESADSNTGSPQWPKKAEKNDEDEDNDGDDEHDTAIRPHSTIGHIDQNQIEDDEKPICRICHCSSEDLETNSIAEDEPTNKKNKKNKMKKHTTKPKSTNDLVKAIFPAIGTDQIAKFDINDPFFLITPCFCAGSLRYVHHKCLQQWIRSSNHKYCELCKYNFKLKTKNKPIYQWESLSMTKSERRKLLFQLSFNLVSIIFVFWSIYVIAERATHELIGQLGWRFWLKMLIISIGFVCGILFVVFQLKLYISTLLRWKQYNQIVIIENVTNTESSNGILSSANHRVISTCIDLTCCESK